MRDKKLHTLVKISILTAFAFVIMLIEIPLPFFASFLQLDLSDLPALFGALAMGPAAGVIIELLKNILHGILKTNTAWIGELANFIVGSAYVLAAGFIYKFKKNKAHALAGLLTGTIAMAIAAALGNSYIFLPLYQKILGVPLPQNLVSFIICSIVPFNLFKGAVVSAIAFFSYKKLSPILHS